MGYFFFSSRRRHTRSLCDWSSDVCSSDLVLVEEWLGADEPLQQAALRARARRASEALATLPLASPEPSLAAALDAAATLYDAGLHFEVHELLEPHWARAGGETKEALQGLIQIAVGYQHLANGNLRGARALLEEGSGRVRGRDKATLETAAAEIARETRAEPVSVAGDLSRLEDVERVVREVHGRFGRIDILVNNAGAIRGGDFFTIPDAQWADDWSLKLLGYIRMARAVVDLMRTQGGGRIINIVGAAARNPSAGYLPGGVANAGLVNFTKGLADLAAPHGILVTAVSPAATATERWERLMAQQATVSGKSLEEYRAEVADRKSTRLNSSHTVISYAVF